MARVSFAGVKEGIVPPTLRPGHFHVCSNVRKCAQLAGDFGQLQEICEFHLKKRHWPLVFVFLRCSQGESVVPRPVCVFLPQQAQLAAKPAAPTFVLGCGAACMCKRGRRERVERMNKDRPAEGRNPLITAVTYSS